MGISKFAPFIAICLAVVGGSRGAPERGDEPGYWGRVSVVVGICAHIDIADGWDEVVVTPLGTVSGHFDAGRVAKLHARARMSAFGNWHPQRGETLLLVCRDADPGPLGSEQNGAIPAVRCVSALFMEGLHAPIARINGALDRTFSESCAAIQRLRAAPPTVDAVSPVYWQTHSLIYATVEQYSPGISNDPPCLYLRPIGTLSGEFDAGAVERLRVNWTAALHDTDSEWRPRAGDSVVVVVQRDEEPAAIWKSPGELSAFMPGRHESLFAAGGTLDGNLSETLARVQQLRGRLRAK